MGTTELSIAQMYPHNGFQLADMLARESVGATILGRASKEAAHEIGFSLDGEATDGLRGKMAEE